MQRPLTTYLTKPSDVEVMELLRQMQAAKTRLRELLGDNFDAVLGPDGDTFLLQPAQEKLLVRVAETERASVTLRRNESMWSNAQRIGRFGSWELDLANLNAVDENPLRWSDEVFRIFGYEPGEIEVSNENFFRAVHPDDRERIKNAVVEAIRTSTNYALDHRIILPDGSVRDVYEHGQVFKDSSSGRPLRMIGIVHDITDRKKLEAQGLRAQRMESIGTLASGIAHDLNNVLAPIMMGVDLLRQFGLEGPSKEVVDGIERSAKRGTSLVKQVLSFSRGDSGARIVVHVGDVIHETESMIRSAYPKNIVVQTEIADDLWLISSDPSLIKQILLNLCANARDAMPDGGRITLAAGNRVISASDGAALQELPAGRYAHIKVADTGRGIPKENLEKIFDPFYTTKELGVGTGLGLAYVLGIVRNHDGFVNVSSQPGEGSVFHIYLPAQSEEANSGGKAQD